MTRAIADAVLAEIDRHLKQWGFSPQGRSGEYRRQMGGARAALLVYFRHLSEAVEINVGVLVRFDAVENLVNDFLGHLSKRKRADTTTLGGNLYNVATERGGEAPIGYTVHDLAEVPKWVGNVVADIEGYALPFLTQYTQMAEAMRLLEMTTGAPPVTSIHYMQALEACAMRFVLGPRAEIPALAAKHIEHLSGIDQAVPEIPKVAGFADYLQRVGSFGASP